MTDVQSRDQAVTNDGPNQSGVNRMTQTTADPVTERIEPNMRALSGSRKGCAGEPCKMGRSSSAEAMASKRQRSAISVRPQAWQRRTTAVRNVRAYPRHSLAEGSSLVGISPLASCSTS